jgi:ZIP family zinc transporter
MSMTESTPLLRTHKSAADGQLQNRAASEHHLSHNDFHNKSTHNHASSHNNHLHHPNGLHKSHSHSTLSTTHDSHDSAIDDSPDTHHHHVPTNAFLSIGLQTSIAIALHKLPEGFITYATNHANPQLGASVFLALFIHNITEGFALALPLYLAMQNRFKAMLISFALGGLSQPLGAGIAALWFRLAGSSNWAPEEGVYGGMFAVTAGIMASVALQLFGESLELSHSKNLCFWGAFVGMAVMGVSSALTA